LLATGGTAQASPSSSDVQAATQPEQFRRSGGDTAQRQKLLLSPNQTHAKVLNQVLSNHLKNHEWEGAYESVAVSDTLAEYGKEIEAAFGRTPRFVQPTAAVIPPFCEATTRRKSCCHQ
jgi:hypothetical protein